VTCPARIAAWGRAVPGRANVALAPISRGAYVERWGYIYASASSACWRLEQAATAAGCEQNEKPEESKEYLHDCHWAGIGGITAARTWRSAACASRCQKNREPGGRCGHFSRQGHTFETGPTLLVMPLLYEAEFATLGVSLREILSLQRVDPTYRLVFDDGSQLALTSDLNAMREQLEAIEPGSFEGFLRYVEEGHRHYHVAMDRLVGRDFARRGICFAGNVPLRSN